MGQDGYSSIRVNVPPFGNNRVRIWTSIEGWTIPISLIDFEVPVVILVEAGHGGKDSGAQGRTDKNVYEKDLTLSYALRLENELKNKYQKEKRVLRIVMPRRTTELFLVPNVRAERARDSGADVLISLHFNSSEQDKGKYPRGTETFVEGPETITHKKTLFWQVHYKT